ncbi:MAG: exodeoxyribonuclease III [Pseudomonadota bacterium]
MVTLATWNVNSIKARLPNVTAWLESFSPDVVLLQETKSLAENFPALEFEALGYHCAVVGQKSYNGVAILSKEPLTDLVTALPGDPGDEQARYLEATTFGLRVATIYLPNGNPIDGEKFPYKLAWMERLQRHARDLLALERPTVLGGDYNVAPADEDVFDAQRFEDDALCQPESRRLFRSILNLGYSEAYRCLHKEAHRYSFWDYQAGAWQKDNGVRIDHLLLSPQAADRLEDCDIDRGPRGQTKASDHTPVWCRLAA